MGLCLRRLSLHYPLEGWQGSTGISGSFQSESVATFDRNRWQGSTGISGNFRPEYAHTARIHWRAAWAGDEAGSDQAG